MRIKVSSSFEELMKRVDCKVILKEAWLDKVYPDFDENTILQSCHKDVKVSANGIWEEDTNLLKLLITIPESNIAKSNDEGHPDAFVTEEYGAIYFFSGNEPAFVIYDTGGTNLDLSLGRNLIDLEFPEDWKGRVELVDTSEDTKFLETFGQNPGKNIFVTGNEDALVSKETYYTYWRLEVTKDTTATDLPLLDENGKLVTENYRYRTYSNLRIDCPGLTKTTTPHTKYGLSDNGGSVPILGYADFVEYRVFGNTITEVMRGTTTIDSIPSSEIVYISGHDDSGIVVDEVHNIFTPNNYSSMIDYTKNNNPGSYGADGIFGLRLTYYDVKEQKPVLVESENQIKLVRRDKSADWFILRSSTHYLESTDEYGDVPVYLFPHNTSGTESFTIRTRFLEPITNTNQLQITFDNPILTDLFTVTPSLAPFVDINGTYYVDILVNLKAKTENEDPVKWAPIIDDVSTLIQAKISYNEYFVVFYMVQCPKIEDSLKLVDNNGNRVDRIVLNPGSGSNKIVYVIADEETEDVGDRNSWRIMSFPDGMTFNQQSGIISGQVEHNPENTLQVFYRSDSTTAQDITPSQDIIITRLKEVGVAEDLETTTNWRVMVDIAQIHVGFMKYGKNISINPANTSISVKGIGLYELKIRSNCRFTLSTEDTRYKFRDQGGMRARSSFQSPSYNDPRYETNEYFNYWVQVETVNATQSITLSPIKILAQEGERTLEKTINVTQSVVSSDIYKLKTDGNAYSDGEWNVTLGVVNNNLKSGSSYVSESWIKRGTSSIINIYNETKTYKEGDFIKYYVNEPEASDYSSSTTYSSGTVVRWSDNWWKSLSESNYGNTPTEGSSYWENVSQYFVSKNNGNLQNLPQQGDSSSWWYEIPNVQNYQELDNRLTSLDTASFYSSTTKYKIGDIVKEDDFSSWVSSTDYVVDSKVKANSNYWICTQQTGANGPEPGVSDGWEEYWREAKRDDFTYYIAKKTMRECTNKWNSTTIYSKDAFVLYGGQVWRSKIDNNVNSHIPPLDPLKWELDFLNINRLTSYTWEEKSGFIPDPEVTYREVTSAPTATTTGEEGEIVVLRGDPDVYYECTNITVTVTPWWSVISDSSLDFVGQDKKYRFIVVREGNIPFLYMSMVAYVTEPSLYFYNLSELRNAILEREDENSEILFVLDNPELYRAGTSIRIVDPDELSRSWQSSSLDHSRRGVVDIYLCISRDNSWVILDTLDSLMMTLGGSYNNTYFSDSSSRCYTKDEYNLRIKYSNLIPSSSQRDVYIISDYKESNSLSSLASTSGFSGNTKKLIPYFNSISELPTLSTLARTSDDNKFIRTYCRIPDGRIVRTVALDLTWDSNNIGPTYKGQYSGSTQYYAGNIVYYTLTGQEKLYYEYKNGHQGQSGHSPIEDTNETYWTCLSWTELSGIDTEAGAINAVKSEMGLKSTNEIVYLGYYPSGTLYTVTKNNIGKEPSPGNIIKLGSKYYYCGVLWKVSDVYVEDLDFSLLSGTSKLPDITTGYTNILCKVGANADYIYYYCKSNYVFNNVKINQYIFVPKTSGNTTQFRFFSRKSPTEQLDTPESNSILALYGGLTIVGHSTPEFDEETSENNHYTSHSIELGYTQGVDIENDILDEEIEMRGDIEL